MLPACKMSEGKKEKVVNLINTMRSRNSENEVDSAQVTAARLEQYRLLDKRFSVPNIYCLI